MLNRLLKWLSSDRSEEPRELSGTAAPEMPSAGVVLLCAHVRDQFQVTLDDPTMREVAQLLSKRNKIEAIKLIREKTRLGLKESKDIADDLEGVMRKT